MSFEFLIVEQKLAKKVIGTNDFEKQESFLSAKKLVDNTKGVTGFECSEESKCKILEIHGV
jgi:hypothetical protein